MNWRKILAALVTKATRTGSTTHAYKSKRKRRKYVSKHVTENKAQMANIDTKRGASRPQTSDGGKATPCWQGRRAAHRALRLPGKTARGGLMQPRACALDGPAVDTRGRTACTSEKLGSSHIPSHRTTESSVRTPRRSKNEWAAGTLGSPGEVLLSGEKSEFRESV